MCVRVRARLVLHLRTCLQDNTIRVITDASDAAKLVARERLLATYNESYLGWRHWYHQTKSCSSLEALRAEVLRETDSIISPHELNHHRDDTVEQTQLARLSFVDNSSNNQSLPISLPHQDVVQLLEQLQPVPSKKPSRQKANQLAEQLAPMLEHDDGTNGKGGEAASLDFLWIDEGTGRIWRQDIVGNDARKDDSLTCFQDMLARLLFRLWQCAYRNVRAITLSLRVTTDTRLHQVCQALEEYYQMSTTICPKDKWCFGPPAEQAKIEIEPMMTTGSTGQDEQERQIRDNRLPYGRDLRYYLIIGTPGALTKSHWDRGVQTVLYHTIAGTNHAVAVPRKVALMLHAVNEALNERMHHRAVANGGGSGEGGTARESYLSVWADELELQVLQKCQDLTRGGTFGPGETMLILPGGGHAVLTGNDGKVVLAGEWHCRVEP